MILALILATATPQTALDAERAFAADAQRLGQWTAFRRWAAPVAILFTPDPQNAHAFLKPLTDPARSVDWWPTASFVSCDGETAANTGGAAWPHGRPGYFSTIWRKQPGGWRWTLDHGDDIATPRPRGEPTVRSAACTGRPTAVVALPPADGKGVEGRSDDGTLSWSAVVEASGARRFRVWLWNGRGFDTVIDDQVPAERAQ